MINPAKIKFTPAKMLFSFSLKLTMMTCVSAYFDPSLSSQAFLDRLTIQRFIVAAFFAVLLVAIEYYSFKKVGSWWENRENREEASEA